MRGGCAPLWHCAWLGRLSLRATIKAFISGEDTSLTSLGTTALGRPRTACAIARWDTSKLESAASPSSSDCSHTAVEKEARSSFFREETDAGLPLV